MSEQRIAILDASHSLFGSNSTNADSLAADAATSSLILRPIPQFREIVAQAVRDARSSGKFASSRIAAIEVGVICDAGGVRALSKVIHSQILEHLKA
jgi:mediator of RNA polymerase II transcription subunit 14